MNLSSLRRWLHGHGISMHAQNLNERQGEPDGPMWQYGRAWIYGFDGDGDTGKDWRKSWEINPEWHVKPRASAGVGLDIGGDSNHEVMLSLDLALARFYLSYDAPWLKHIQGFLPGHWFDLSRLAEPYRKPERHWLVDPVEVSIRWHDGGLWWAFWMHPHEWKARESKWRRGHWDLADSLLGRMQFEKREIAVETVQVPMPEKTYSATVKLERCTWKRTRWPWWPFTRSGRYANIEVPGGIAHPGKGENSWDCGDDATYSIHCQAHTAEEAAGKFVASVLRDRRRYGGKNWRPQDTETVA